MTVSQSNCLSHRPVQCSCAAAACQLIPIKCSEFNESAQLLVLPLWDWHWCWTPRQDSLALMTHKWAWSVSSAWRHIHVVTVITTWLSVFPTSERGQRSAGERSCWASSAASPPGGGRSGHSGSGSARGSCPAAGRRSPCQPPPATQHGHRG